YDGRQIKTTFNQIVSLLPPNAEEVVKYFEINYVHGRVRRQLRNGNEI
ncbi:7794_t:CDS:2, partial [Scutellospora calospora]